MAAQPKACLLCQCNAGYPLNIYLLHIRAKADIISFTNRGIQYVWNKLAVLCLCTVWAYMHCTATHTHTHTHTHIFIIHIQNGHCKFMNLPSEHTCAHFIPVTCVAAVFILNASVAIFLFSGTLLTVFLCNPSGIVNDWYIWGFWGLSRKRRKSAEMILINKPRGSWWITFSKCCCRAEINQIKIIRLSD